MKPRNKMCRSEYILRHIAYAVIVAVIWRACPIYKYTEPPLNTAGRIFLYMFIALMYTGCYLVTRNTRRSWVNALVNAIIPVGVYTIVTTSYMFKGTAVTALCVTVCISLLLAYGIFGHRKEEYAEGNTVMKKRTMKWLYGTRAIVAVAVIVLMCVLNIRVMGERSQPTPVTEAVLCYKFLDKE